MITRCCRSFVACSVVVSLAGVSAHAQSVTAPPPASPSAQGPTGDLRSEQALRGRSSFFSNLFATTISDFKQLPSRENLLIAGLGGAVAGFSRPNDWKVSQSLGGSHEMGEFFSAGKTLGGAALQLGGAVATQVIGRATGNRRVAAIGSDLVRAQILTQTLTIGIKASVRRGRPDGTQFSFPSGHASTTFATATVLQRHLGWKAGVPAYALATYVAASRVQVQRHFLSDVAAGAALGIIAGRSVTVGRGDARFAVGPSAVPGGGGVSLTWLGKR
jgi:hypothetical protein